MGAERRWLDDALVIAMVGSVGDLRRPGRQRGAWSPLSRRKTIVFASVLSAGSSPRRGSGCDRSHDPRDLRRRVAVSLCFVASLGYTLAQPVAAQSASTLASWLEAHHLRRRRRYWARASPPSRAGVRSRCDRCGRTGWRAWLVHEAVPLPAGTRSAVPVSRLRDACLPRRRQCLGGQDLGPPAHTYVVGGYTCCVVQHLQRRTVSTAAGSAQPRAVRPHMIASHAQTTALPCRIIDPLIVEIRGPSIATSDCRVGIRTRQPVDAFQVETGVQL